MGFFTTTSANGGGGFFSGSSDGQGGAYSSAYGAPPAPEPDPVVTEKHNQLAAVARLAHGSDDDRRKAQRFLEDNQQMYTDDELAQYGLRKPGHDSRSLFEKAKGSTFGAIRAAFGVISRPQQVVAHGLRAVGTELGGVGLLAQGKTTPGQFIRKGIEGAKETWQAAGDIQGKHDINTREMLNLDKGAGGSGWVGDYLVGGLDMAGQIVTDPLSWVGTAGSKEAAKAGLKTLEEAEVRGLARPGIAARVAREGGGILTAEERQAVRDIGIETAKTSGAGQRGRLASRVLGSSDKTGGPLARLKEGALQHAVGEGDKVATGRLNARYWLPTGTGTSGAERVAEKNLTAMLARSEPGIKFGGQTVIKSSTLRGPLEARSLLPKAELVANPALAAAHGEADEIAGRLNALSEHAQQAEEGRTAWMSKSKEALPAAVARRDAAATARHEAMTALNDADPEVYVKPEMVPNPDLPKANQDYLKHNSRLSEIEAEGSKIEEAQNGIDAQRKDLEAQLRNLEDSKMNFQHNLAGKFDGATRSSIEEATRHTDEQIDRIHDAIEALDKQDDIHAGRLADLNEEYEQVGRLADEAASTPKEIYREGSMAPNPEVNLRAKLPAKTEISEPRTLEDGSYEIKAMVDGKPGASVNYRIGEDGTVDIEGIITLDNQRRQGLGRALLSEIEKHTGQSAADFTQSGGVLDTGEDFWKAVKNEGEVSRPSLAKAAQDAERDFNRAEAEVKRLEKKVGVTAEKQTARAEGKLQRIAERRARLEEKAAKLDERLPRIAPEAIDITPSRFLRTERTLTRLRRSFITGSEVADSHGKRVAEALKNLREMVLGSSSTDTHIAARSLRNVMRAAAVEDRSFLDDLPKIYRSLETGTADELAMQYAEQGRTKAADAIRHFANMNAEDTRAMVDEGFLPEEFLHGKEEGGAFMKRVPTPEADRAAQAEREGLRRGSPARAASLSKAEATQGSTFARTYRPHDILSDDLQADMAEKLGLKPGTKAIEDNPALSIMEHRAELNAGRAHRKFIEEASNIYDDAGLPMVTTDRDLARVHGYVSVPTPQGEVYAPKAIAKEVGRFQDVVFNDESIKAFQRMMDKTMRIWKAHATVPLVGMAFHSRNAETNVMLNWIAGVENPVWYARSARIQKKLGTAFDALGADTNFEQALDAAKLTDREKKWVKLAQEHNVLNTSQTSIDLAGTGGSSFQRQLSERATEPGLRGRAIRTPEKLNPLNPETFMGTTSGHAVAGGLENNARLAHFMWAMDKYGDPEIAAQSVKKYLFNYADLTPFEREKMKRIIPFYTFMRKNVGLMATTLAENPGKMSRFAMLQRQTEDPNAGFLAGQLTPEYITEMGQTARKGPGLGGITASIESPWSAAADVLSPAAEIAGMTPGLNRAIPKEFKGKGPEDTALKLINIPGGPAAEALKYTAERALGKDTYTGGPVHTMNPLGEALRITDIFAPSPSKVVRLSDKLTQGDITGKHTTPAEGDERTRRRAAAVINAIFGLNTNAEGKLATQQEITRRFFELQDYIDVRNKDLPDGDPRRVPSIQELRDAGVIPPAASKRQGYARSGY